MGISKKRSYARKRIETENKQQSNSNRIVERESIPDTPFQAIKLDEKWFLVTGKYRLSTLYDSYQEAYDAVKKPTWEMITCVMETVIDAVNEHNKNLKTN